MGALVADYFRAYRWRWIVGVLFTVVSTVFGLVTPWLLRQAIDTFATPGGSQLGWGLPAFAAAIVVVALFEGASRSWPG